MFTSERRAFRLSPISTFSCLSYWSIPPNPPPQKKRDNLALFSICHILKIVPKIVFLEGHPCTVKYTIFDELVAIVQHLERGTF